MRQHLNMLREFSVPLVAGVVAAMAWAGVDRGGYDAFVHGRFLGQLSFHFVTNDLFMAFFFGIAAAEIVRSCLPGGDLNPPRSAMNPLFATAGGIVGPALVYLCGTFLLHRPSYAAGWGIPTATDIALAWLAARVVFGREHPAISFLLLLAVADDAVGMAIIAVFYPDASQPPAPVWLLLTAAGMLCAWVLRRSGARSYWPYFILGGGAAWSGLYLARLHPALALVFIVPFLPDGRGDRHRVFEEEPGNLSPLHRFEHEWKVIVDVGMFMFGLANAGVCGAGAGAVTWLVLGSLVVGKTAGIFGAALLAVRAGFPLPERVTRRELFVVSFLAGIGFTVSLFIAGEAFPDPQLQAQAKTGALMSIAVLPAALLLRPFLRRRRRS